MLQLLLVDLSKPVGYLVIIWTLIIAIRTLLQGTSTVGEFLRYKIEDATYMLNFVVNNFQGCSMAILLTLQKISSRASPWNKIFGC